MNLDPRALAYLRPSGAGVWSICAAYIRACLNYEALPETAEDVRVREEGTACHWVAEQMFLGNPVGEGDIAPNGVPVDGDMLDAATMYVRHCGLNGLVEQRVACDLIYPGVSGSPDHHAWGDGWLNVNDLKYGFGYVDAYQNLQLSIYALVLGEQYRMPDDTVVRISIVQPRAITNEGPIRTWATTLGWLRTNMLPKLQRAAWIAMSVSAPATAGLHCLDCPGRFQCSTHINMAREVCRHSTDSVPMEMTPAMLGAELRIVKDMLKILEGRKESLQAQVESLMRSGKSVPGWSFKPSKGREAYLPGMEKAFIGAAKLYGVDATRPITPGDARRKLPAVMVDAFTNRPKAGLALHYEGEREIKKSFKQE